MRLSELSGKRVVIWGTGLEGQAAFQLLNAAPLTSLEVVDDNLPEDFPVPVMTGMELTDALMRADVVVKSPGISMYDARIQEAVAQGSQITNGTAMFLAERGGENVIAVTGSKGKSTTAALITYMLRALDRNVELAGNIGRSPLDLLETDATVVLEVSSFQAANVSAHPRIGVLTELFPEHLDWHANQENYFRDKLRLFNPATTRLCVNATSREAIKRTDTFARRDFYGETGDVHVGDEEILVNDESLMPVAEIPLSGVHNAVNVCGALSALRACGVDLRGQEDEIRKSIRSFEGLPHRLQVVGTHRKATVIDDGIATAPHASAAAIASFPEKRIALVCGGFDRGVPLDEVIKAIRSNDVSGFATGPVGKRLAEALPEKIRLCENFDEAVQHAANTDGFDVIMLSPAASSFDEFANYVERSKRFVELMRKEGMEESWR